VALSVIAILLSVSDQQVTPTLPQTAPVAQTASPAPLGPAPGAVPQDMVLAPADGPPVIPVLPLVQLPAGTVPVFAADATPPGTDIVVTARGDWEAPDPLAGINAKSFEVTQTIDRSLIGPVSMAYKKKVPGPIRDGIHNFLYNLREPVVFINFVLQHKIGKAVETVGRFVVNSTIGAIGLFDIARRRPFRLPRRSNGFANTLGFYGVPNGTFLYLPLVGPTTVRDLFGGAVDRLILPIALGQGVTDPKFAVPAGALGALDHRAEFDETYKAIDTAPGDRYGNARDFYLQRRQAEIDRLHGRGKDGMGGQGGMTDAPTDTIRLKGRGGAPTVAVPVDPAPAATSSGPAPAPTATPAPAPVPPEAPAP
jgi:phospholipid-binding lipoprotein MlaA